MKIIAVDNFNRDNHSDTLVAENVLAYYAPFIVNSLNSKFSGKDAPIFFTMKPDNYKLYKFEP